MASIGNQKKQEIIESTFLHNVTLEDFINCSPYTFPELRGKSRKTDLKDWRQVGMLVAYVDTNANRSQEEASGLFNKNYSTLIHAIKEILPLINHVYIIDKIRQQIKKRLYFEKHIDPVDLSKDVVLANMIFNIPTFTATRDELIENISSLKKFLIENREDLINENINPKKL